jgi:hypothetical protein
MEPGASCPTDGSIVPLTQSNLVKVGVRRASDILQTINWRLITGVLLSLLLVAVTVLVSANHIQARPWEKGRGKDLGVVVYRTEGSTLPLETFHSKGQIT